MDDNDLMDGTPGTPTQVIPAENRQGSAEGNSDIEALRKEIQSISQVIKGLQSDKDRGVDRLGKRVDEIQQRYESYRALRDSGKTHEQAERELALDDLLRERQPSGSAGASGNQKAVGNRPDTTFDAMPLLVEYGIPDNDPEVVQMASDGRLNNPAEVTRLVARRLAPQPKTGQVQAGPGGTAANPDLRQQYEAELVNAQKQGTRSVLELRRKYRQKGLNI